VTLGTFATLRKATVRFIMSDRQQEQIIFSG